MKKLLLIAAMTFSVVALQAQCQADFGYTNSVNVFTFSDSSTTSSGTINGWFWQFGDNTPPSNQQNPQHTYEACGYYEVTLTIFTTTFCSSSYTDTIFVAQGTQPSFTFTVDTTTGDVDFQGDPFSTTLDYSWDFGDSTFSTQQNPVHTYDSSGTYIVCFTVSDTGGYCTYTICDTVVVYIAPANCSATWTNNPGGPGQQTFTAQPIDPNWNYSWDFGDASAPGNGFITTHTYTVTGTYTVCLTVTDTANNCTSQFCDTVNVVVTCNATWTNQSIIAGQQTFTAQPFNLNWTYTWDFGDLTAPGNGFIVNHTYANAGTYTVCLTVYDSATTCTSQFCDTVQIVFPSNCPVTFTNVYLAGNMAFTPTPFNPLNTYVWDFGDATALFTGIFANHTYAAPGTYTVCVVMTTFQGCTDSFCDTVMVPTVGFEEYEGGIVALMVYPNPASQNIAVNYTLTQGSDITLEIIDITGRVIFVRNENYLQAGTQRADILLDEFASGSYVLRLRTETGQSRIPFVKE
jgi:PKD repeat protein